MEQALTVGQHPWRRLWSFLAGAGMIAASAMTIRHFFLANFPDSIYKGAFCDISAFFNCDGSAFSPIAQIWGVPMGWFGLVVGSLVVLGAVFPSPRFERTNKSLSLLNALGVLALLGYSLFVLKSLCLLCSGFYLFSLFSFFLFWKLGLRGAGKGIGRFFGSYLKPSLAILIASAVVVGAGGYGFHEFHGAKQQAQLGGTAAKMAKEFFSLAVVPEPSFISPYRIAQATERWEDAPIRVIEFSDYTCPDCLFLHQQLSQLKKDFAGKLNIAYQFFPLEGKCNHVVEKDIHPGACDLALIAAYDPGRFPSIHEEIFANFQEAKKPEWRAELVKRYGLEAALTDEGTKAMVERIIQTGAEYEKTSDKFSHGIRSTPTMIINGRMIIGTLPYANLKAIFQAVLEMSEKPAQSRFIENWENTRPKAKPKTGK
ncbi:MAG: thioredoxin domain-containing protein [Candidatus Aminicenantes bacterium]|nr:thioredoxin domain-containing protein [Candidatus Aminicenantes bacterium]